MYTCVPVVAVSKGAMILKVKSVNLSYSRVIFCKLLISLAISYTMKIKEENIHMQIKNVCIIFKL